MIPFGWPLPQLPTLPEATLACTKSLNIIYLPNSKAKACNSADSRITFCWQNLSQSKRGSGTKGILNPKSQNPSNLLRCCSPLQILVPLQSRSPSVSWPGDSDSGGSASTVESDSSSSSKPPRSDKNPGRTWPMLTPKREQPRAKQRQAPMHGMDMPLPAIRRTFDSGGDDMELNELSSMCLKGHIRPQQCSCETWQNPAPQTTLARARNADASLPIGESL